MVESGSPCTNCRLDEVECLVSDSKRRRKPRADGDSNHSPMSSTEETDELADWPSFEDADGMSAFSPSVNNLIASGSLDFELNTHVPHMLCP